MISLSLFPQKKIFKSQTGVYLSELLSQTLIGMGGNLGKKEKGQTQVSTLAFL